MKHDVSEAGCASVFKQQKHILLRSGRQPVVREKISVVRGEIWTLFAIFMFIILISNKQQQISH
jgi:hypothetical protein